MQAHDVMTGSVATVMPDTPVEEIARRMLERRVSGLPVVEANGTLVGIVSEGDLLRRAEPTADHRLAGWLELMSAPADRILSHLQGRGRVASEVMSSPVWTVDERAPLGEIAELLERRRIKRVPVLKNGAMIGIVSRADLLHGLATQQARRRVRLHDRKLRESITERLRLKIGMPDDALNVTVADGVVHLWGSVRSQQELEAARLFAESLPGVRAVRNHMRVLPPVAATDA